MEFRVTFALDVWLYRDAHSRNTRVARDSTARINSAMRPSSPRGDATRSHADVGPRDTTPLSPTKTPRPNPTRCSALSTKRPCSSDSPVHTV
jgi:hypothetical protein